MKPTKKINSSIFNSWSFGKVNYQLFGISLLIIVIGYLLMATGETNSIQSIKLAPILLVIGYCIVLPISIIYKSK